MNAFVASVMATAKPLTEQQIQRLRSLLCTARTERQMRAKDDDHATT